MDHSPLVAAFAGVGCILYVGLYVYLSLCLYKIAIRLHLPDPWMAWVPIINLVIMVRASGRPLWWIVLLLIPFVNLVIGVIIWMDIAVKVGRPNWWGLLLLIPVVNLVILGLMAFSEAPKPAAS